MPGTIPGGVIGDGDDETDDDVCGGGVDAVVVVTGALAGGVELAVVAANAVLLVSRRSSGGAKCMPRFRTVANCSFANAPTALGGWSVPSGVGQSDGDQSRLAESVAAVLSL